MGKHRWIIAFTAYAALCSCGKAPKDAPTPTVTTPSAQMSMHAPATLAEWAHGAQLFDGLGDFHRAISTTLPEAQRYFDQGMRLMWAFNHDEATRSFARAAELDPSCGACYWGVSLTVGPNYNLPFMSAERARVAFDALAKARQQASHGSKVEQSLIEALGSRYPTAAPLDPSTAGPILTAYAAAMKTLAQRFPKDADVQTLYAEALMNVNAWKLWGADGKPTAGTDEIVATL